MLELLQYLFLLSSFVYVTIINADQAGSIVQTIHGPVQGVLRELKDGRPYEAFLGIPFGGDTGGSNRWLKPTSPIPWKEPLDCSEFRPYCPQLISKGYPLIGLNGKHSEECLHLNIFIPRDMEDTNADVRLPVVLFLYGGIYIVGASDMYPGENLAVNGKVIVVTSNYRVGTMGFMSSGDKNAPGNAGLWDDVLALEWVQDNIARFGGDPSRVTLVGQSAGAASASHLLTSDRTRHLFKRMIAISGSSTSYFSNTKLFESSTRSLALLNLCPIFSYYRMVDCLRSKGPFRLDLFGMAAPAILKGYVPNWVPMVDGDFIPRHPRDTWSTTGEVADHDILVGSTRDDGAGIILANPLGMGYGSILSLARNQKIWNLIIKLFLNVFANVEELYELVLKEYPDLVTESNDDRIREACKFLTDYFFMTPAMFEAFTHSGFSNGVRGKTYLYEFSYRQSFQKYPSWVNGSHVDDLYSLFGDVFLEQLLSRWLRTEWSSDDYMVSKNIQGYYMNFVYTGNPNEGPHEVPTYWPQFNAQTRQYMEQSANMVVKEVDEDRMHTYHFWIDEFYNLLRRKSSFDESTTPLPFQIDWVKALDLMEKLQTIASVAEESPETALETVFEALEHLIDDFS